MPQHREEHGAARLARRRNEALRSIERKSGGLPLLLTQCDRRLIDARAHSRRSVLERSFRYGSLKARRTLFSVALASGPQVRRDSAAMASFHFVLCHPGRQPGDARGLAPRPRDRGTGRREKAWSVSGPSRSGMIRWPGCRRRTAGRVPESRRCCWPGRDDLHGRGIERHGSIDRAPGWPWWRIRSGPG